MFNGTTDGFSKRYIRTCVSWRCGPHNRHHSRAHIYGDDGDDDDDDG